jgi:hypothetical protein
MFLLDTNTYIQAKNFHYHMDFCPAYWDWLDAQYATGFIGSVESVYDEIVDKGDELSQWVIARKNHFDAVSDQQTQQNMALISQYVIGMPNKTQEHISKFLSGADPWLIAKAMVNGFTIVTHEIPVPDNSQKVKIPNVCKNFGVPYIDTYELLKRLQARFVLQ